MGLGIDDYLRVPDSSKANLHLGKHNKTKKTNFLYNTTKFNEGGGDKSRGGKV